MITIRRYRSVLRSPARLFLAFIAAIILVASRSSGPLGLLQAEDNPILAENQLTGDTDWDISGSGHASIQGFATDMSVNVGGTINFKIDTPSNNYRVDIYRLGYYSGAGARKVATVLPSAPLPQVQPSCATQPSSGLVDCGTWAVSASWAVPATAVSGIYIAKPTRLDAPIGAASHIVFVVRDDARQADVLFQTSDTTWQAYNNYGGNSLYCGSPISNAGSAYGCSGRAAKVSYNRPFTTRVTSNPSWVFSAEYPMLRFLEANGFNVKYWSGVDSDRFGANPTVGLTSAKKPKVFLSVGHDEYWSGAQRTNVENARNAGVNLAFMSGNEVFWKTRWESSIDGSGTPHRTLVSYKDTLAGVKLDPMPNVTTGTWRDMRFGPPNDGGRPENALIGSIWTVNSGTSSITVPAAMTGSAAVAQHPRRSLCQTVNRSTSASIRWATNGAKRSRTARNPPASCGCRRRRWPAWRRSSTIGSHVGYRTGDAQPDALSSQQRRARVRRQHRAVVVGPRRRSRRRLPRLAPARSGHAAGDGEPARRHGRAAVEPADRRGPGPAVGHDRPLIRHLRADLDDHVPRQRAARSKAATAPPSAARQPTTAAAPSAAVEVSVDGGTTWKKATGTSLWSIDWTPGAVGTANIRTPRG